MSNREPSAKADGRPIDQTIDKHILDMAGRRMPATAVKGTVPGPLLRLRDGQKAVIRVCCCG